MKYVLIFHTDLFVAQMNEQGGNDNLLRDLIMTSVETLINYWLFADYFANTRSPWDAERILHLVIKAPCNAMHGLLLALVCLLRSMNY